MELRNYYGKYVHVIDVNGHTFSGKVNDYIYPEDNEHGMESIIIDTHDGDIVELTEKDIDTITII